MPAYSAGIGFHEAQTLKLKTITTMKKIFTLLMLAFVAQVTFADDVIASYTFPDQMLSTGSSASATGVAGTNCTIDYAKVGGNEDSKGNKQYKILNETQWYHKFTNATSAWIKITLTSGSFQAGDKFYATLYSGSASDDGFYFKTPATGNSKVIKYDKDAENLLEYTLTDDDINDDGSLTVYRFNSNCYVRHIEVTRASGATKEDPTTEFTTPIDGFKLSAGTSTGQTVTTNSDGAVTYESSNTNVVAVDSSTGALTGVAVGKAKITAKTASSSTYSASSASYTVYVLSDGDGTLENPYLPTDFRYLAETAEEGSTEKAWVVGYIVGVYNSEAKDVKIVNSTTGTSSSIGLGNAANEAVGSNCLTVQLISETDPRTNLNLNDNPTKLKEKVWVYGKIGSFTSSEQTVYGLCHADNYSLDGSTIVPEMTSVTNITVEDQKADGKIYNLSGMEVKTPAKGVYIQNGKKFVVK